MKIHPVGVEFFHADGQTDRYEESNSRFSQICEQAQKRNKYVGAFYLSKTAHCSSSTKLLRLYRLKQRVIQCESTQKDCMSAQADSREMVL